MESELSSTYLFEHDLIRKPVPTFRDHALRPATDPRRLAADAGPIGRAQERKVTVETQERINKPDSTWVVVTEMADNLAALTSDSCWHRLEPRFGLRLWADDHFQHSEHIALAVAIYDLLALTRLSRQP